MLQNITPSTTLSAASSEIAIIFLWTLILGMALGWLLKPTASSKTQSEDVATASLALPADDDLQMIEGVGPAIEKLLNKHEVYNFQDIIDAGVPGLEEILETGGSRFKMHIPTTWPDQARLASAWKWSELEEYQDILSEGKIKK